VWGVILAKVIYLKKSIRLKRGLQMIYFSLVNGLLKMAFPHLNTHALWIGKSCFHVSMQRDFSLFIQIKLNFWVTLWFFMFFWFFFQKHFFFFFSKKFLLFFFRFSRCMFTFLKNHLNFQNSFVLDKHQHDFCFCTKLWIPKNPCEYVRSCII
jgi:hypothetical protein